MVVEVPGDEDLDLAADDEAVKSEGPLRRPRTASEFRPAEVAAVPSFRPAVCSFPRPKKAKGGAPVSLAP